MPLPMYDSWRNVSSTSSEFWKDSFQALVDDQFENSGSLKTVIHKNSSVVVRVVGKFNTETLSRNNDDYQKIIFKDSTYAVDVGDIFIFDSLNWLTTDISSTPVSKSCSVSKCNNTLKFYKNGTLHQLPCIFSDGTISLDSGKFLSLPSGHYMVTIASGTITKADLNLRFILNDSAYKVYGISNTTNGLIKIEIEDDDFVADDSRILGIANYYSNQITYGITILNGTLIKKFFSDDPFQIHVECTENGEIVTNPTVTYSSGEELVCTVSETGLVTLIGTGTTDITVTFGNATDLVTIESNIGTEDNYNVVVTPSDTTLKANRSITLNAMATNNGVDDLLKEIGFTVTNDDGSSNRYVTYIVNENSITLTAGTVLNKLINIRAYMKAYPDIYFDRQIKIVSLI